MSELNTQFFQNSAESGDENVLMETEYLNTRFPGSLSPTCYGGIQCVDEKKKDNIPAVVWEVCMAAGTGPLGAAARTDDDIKFYEQKIILFHL